MMKLGEFTVECLGVHYSDYFQGYGVAFSEHSDCTYGIGNTEAEALNDCIENMAQAASLDFDDDTEESIRDEYGYADGSITALDKVDVTALDEYPDKDCPECGNDISDIEFGDNCAKCGKEFDYPEHVPYWHVGIKWNYRENARLQRIRDMQVEPLTYSDYRPTRNDDGHATSWGSVTRAEGSGSYGDFESAEWPESAASYLGALSDDILESGDLYFYVPHTTGSDYSGSTVEAANYQCFVDGHTFGEHDWIHAVYGGHNTYAVAIGLTGLLACADDTFDEICEAIEGLEDYPVLDDDMVCEVETDNIEEAWISWVSREFTREVEREYDDCLDFIWPADDDLRCFFEDKASESDTYWYNEGYGPDMYIDISEIVATISFDDISKWVVHYKLTYFDPGEVWESFTDLDECIERKEALLAAGFIGPDYIIVQPETADATVPT